jgi:hypothetical protein
MSIQKTKKLIKLIKLLVKEVNELIDDYEQTIKVIEEKAKK